MSSRTRLRSSVLALILVSCLFVIFFIMKDYNVQTSMDNKIFQAGIEEMSTTDETLSLSSSRDNYSLTKPPLEISKGQKTILTILSRINSSVNYSSDISFINHIRPPKNGISRMPTLQVSAMVLPKSQSHTEKELHSHSNNSRRIFYESRDVHQIIQENNLYKSFNIAIPRARVRLDILIVVSTAPQRLDRREAIRDTWWKSCLSKQKSIKCVFMTDEPRVNYSDLLREKDRYGDIQFQHLEGGVNFGQRYLYHLVWAYLNYDFGYFLRIDDDYFLCLDRFIQELPLPTRPHFHWGYVHCIDQLTRPEESIIMFSQDLVITFLLQNPERIMCHPWADQQIALWVTELDLEGSYHHDLRLHHDPPSSFLFDVLSKKNICQDFIGLHGTYPHAMRILWENRGRWTADSLDRHLSVCPYKSIMNWTMFNYPWRYEPKRCITNPSWDTGHQYDKNSGYYHGRQGE